MICVQVESLKFAKRQTVAALQWASLTRDQSHNANNSRQRLEVIEQLSMKFINVSVDSTSGQHPGESDGQLKNSRLYSAEAEGNLV